MLTHLKIRTLLLALVAIAIAALGALAATGFISGQQLDRQQSRLTDVALPLLKQNIKVYATVAELTRQLLTVRDGSGESGIANAGASIAEIQASYGDLDALVQEMPEASAALTTVKTQFATFIERDLELQAARGDLAKLETELALLNKRIEDSVRLSEQNAQTIAGRTRLATFRQKRALKRQLGRGSTQPLTGSARATLNDLLYGQTGEAPVLAASVRSDVVALADLSRQLMLATSRDEIVSLHANRMTQVAARLNSNLDKLETALAKQPALTSRFVILKAAVNGLVAQSVGQEHSAFAIRQSWIDTNERVVATTEASHQAIGALLTGLSELSVLAQTTSDATSAASGQVIATSRTAFVLVSVVVGSLVLLFGSLVRRRVNTTFTRALTIAKRIGDGHLDSDIDTHGSDESADLMRAMSRMQSTLGEARDSSASLLRKTGRAQQALESVQSSVMIANADDSVVYMNQSLRRLFGQAEADLRACAPGFSVDTLMGSSLPSLLASLGLRGAALRELAAGTAREVTAGRRCLRLAASDVLDDNGQRIGTVIEWRDRTVEVAIEQEVQSLVDAARHGDLEQRIATADKTGFFATLGNSINDLLAATSGVIHDTLRVFGALSRGDLSQTINGDYLGAFGQLKADANATSAKLGNVMSEINTSSQMANRSAEDIREASTTLAQRSESQVAGLADTAASMARMTETVRENAGNAQSANEIAGVALNQAESGGQVVGQAVDAMVQIRGSSAKIAEIIGVIDEIAFQTNLLALNASVEAARAGERGRGFAVVASEVRDLAGRSATAASEIKELIENSVSQVNEGYRLVEASGQTLNEIVQGVKEVSDIVGTIANASREQSRGITDVNEAVSKMDAMTRENSKIVARFAEASVELGGQAQRMRELMAFFSVDDTKPARPSTAEPGSAPTGNAERAA